MQKPEEKEEKTKTVGGGNAEIAVQDLNYLRLEN